MSNLAIVIANAIVASPDAQKVAQSIEDFANTYKSSYRAMQKIPFMRILFEELVNRLDIRI